VSEPVRHAEFGTAVEPRHARPEETSHWINDDPIGFTWRDGTGWATSEPYTGTDTTGFTTKAQAIAALVSAYTA
jgi:hypothetical protein